MKTVIWAESANLVSGKSLLISYIGLWFQYFIASLSILEFRQCYHSTPSYFDFIIGRLLEAAHTTSS